MPNISYLVYAAISYAGFLFCLNRFHSMKVMLGILSMVPPVFLVLIAIPFAAFLAYSFFHFLATQSMIQVSTSILGKLLIGIASLVLYLILLIVASAVYDISKPYSPPGAAYEEYQSRSDYLSRVSGLNTAADQALFKAILDRNLAGVDDAIRQGATRGLRFSVRERHVPSGGNATYTEAEVTYGWVDFANKIGFRDGAQRLAGY